MRYFHIKFCFMYSSYSLNTVFYVYVYVAVALPVNTSTVDKDLRISEVAHNLAYVPSYIRDPNVIY